MVVTFAGQMMLFQLWLLLRRLHMMLLVQIFRSITRKCGSYISILRFGDCLISVIIYFISCRYQDSGLFCITMQKYYWIPFILGPDGQNLSPASFSKCQQWHMFTMFCNISFMFILKFIFLHMLFSPSGNLYLQFI